MFLGFLVLLTGLTISAVAIYYSVAGLVAIFAAAAIPIIIMGGALEIAKLVTAIWLHRYWHQATWWLKTYLSFAVIVLMFITSMGIFGFLSKAHIDQTASASESLARLEQIAVQIIRQEDIVIAAENEIAKIETSGTSRDAEIQLQIDREQVRIDSAYERIQPAINEQNQIIAREEQRLSGGLTLYQNQLATVEQNLANIERYISSNNITALQALVGVRADGNLGPATRSAIDEFRINQTAEQQRLSELIARETGNISSPVIDAARAEIQRLRSLAEQEIARSNELVNRLREQLGTTDTNQITNKISQQNTIIENAEIEIARLTEEKFNLESEYRKLEAEVGPIKYLAEFVYGTSDNKDLLEEAVRWVIVLIIFVFDPLAVLLLIASQYTFNFEKQKNNDRRILENDNDEQFESKETTTITEPEIQLPKITTEGIRAEPKERDLAVLEGRIDDAVEEPQKKSLELLEESKVDPQETLEQTRLESWNEKEITLRDAKHRWKEEHPEETIKFHKTLYIKGKIDKLPWEEERYVQNSEQREDSLFKKLQDARSKNDQN